MTGKDILDALSYIDDELLERKKPMENFTKYQLQLILNGLMMVSGNCRSSLEICKPCSDKTLTDDWQKQIAEAEKLYDIFAKKMMDAD